MMNELKRKRSTVNPCLMYANGDSQSETSSVQFPPEKNEVFFQAFEKPTQIYRFLRIHTSASLTFMHRNLSYMKPRMARNHKSRASCKIDKFAEQLREKLESKDDRRGQTLSIAFCAINDSNLGGTSKLSKCSVKVQIAKVTHSRRKDIAPQTEFDKVGDVPINQNDDFDCKPFVIELSNEKLRSVQGGKTVMLISTFLDKGELFSDSSAQSDILTDGGEPSQKRRRRHEQSYSYQADLCVSNDGQNMVLTDADYELALKKRGPSQPPYSLKNNHNIAWKHLIRAEDSENIQSPFKEFPVLKLQVSWSRPEANAAVVSASTKKCKADEKNGGVKSEFEGIKLDKKALEDDKAGVPLCNGVTEPEAKMVQIHYRFFNNNELQTTIGQANFQCPWCSINCLQIRPLCYHLKNCHNRLNFAFQVDQKSLNKIEAKIDISINENYDGSYSGNPFDLSHGCTGMAFSRNGPVRRSAVTSILVGGKRSKRNTGNIDPDDDELDLVNPLVMGHDRLYYHTNTCLPIRPRDMEIDSEEENDPEWMKVKTQLMIDDFTDVNAGEKDIMKKWNLHIMKYGFVGDCQMYDACRMFVEQQGQKIWAKKLYSNFLLHLGNLFDYGLLDGVQKLEIVRLLQTMKDLDAEHIPPSEDVVQNSTSSTTSSLSGASADSKDECLER